MKLIPILVNQYTNVMKGVTDNFTENTHLTVTCFGKSYPVDNIKKPICNILKILLLGIL